MITITPNLNQLKRAKTLYDFGILDNSITQGDGSAAGAIAEICFFDYFKEIGKEIIHAKHYDYDFIWFYLWFFKSSNFNSFLFL